MFKKLFESLSGPAAPAAAIRSELAMAALLVHAARSDGDYAESEKSAIDRALREEFSLDAEAAARLRAEAETADADAPDLVRFTQSLKDALSEEAREQFLEQMWRVVLADGVRDADENALMRKLAGLLYVPDGRNNAARLRAAARLKA